MMRSNKGGILIYILGVIALLSIVVTEFLMETAEAIRYRSQVTHRDDLEILAYSALEVTMAVLGEIKAKDKGLYSPLQDWKKPLEYAKFKIPTGYTVSIDIKDETGKLSIYQEDLKTFGNLMTEIGISSENIGNLKSDLKKWLDKPPKGGKDSKPSVPEAKPGEKPEDENAPQAPSSPNADNPEANANPSDATNRSNNANNQKKKEQRVVYNLLQLKELPSFERVFFDKDKNPNEKFQLLKDNVSILYKGVVNINTAPELIKKLLLGSAPKEPATIDGKNYFRTMEELGIAKDAATELKKVLGFKMTVLNIGVQVTRGTVKYYLNTIVQVKEGDSNDAKKEGDFTFLALTEDGTFDK